MIDVQIYENKGLCARCFITGDEDESNDDLRRIKAIPYSDRLFISDSGSPKFWRVLHAEQYKDMVVEIGDAIRIYKRQLRMF